MVENGSVDATFTTAKAYEKKMSILRVFQEKNRGKGLAVRRGMLEAAGEYRFLCDADLSMPIEQLSRFIPPVLEKADIAIGSREVSGSRRIGEPGYRHWVGRVFNAMVRWILLPGLQDTQCGFKCIREDVAEVIFPLQTLDGMSFDAEVLYIARRKGFQIQEVAIDWYFDPDSRVRLIQDSLLMAFDLLLIRINAKKGLYGGKT